MSVSGGLRGGQRGEGGGGGWERGGEPRKFVILCNVTFTSESVCIQYVWDLFSLCHHPQTAKSIGCQEVILCEVRKLWVHQN